MYYRFFLLFFVSHSFGRSLVDRVTPVNKDQNLNSAHFQKTKQFCLRRGETKEFASALPFKNTNMKNTCFPLSLALALAGVNIVAENLRL